MDGDGEGDGDGTQLVPQFQAWPTLHQFGKGHDLECSTNVTQSQEFDVERKHSKRNGKYHSFPSIFTMGEGGKSPIKQEGSSP